MPTVKLFVIKGWEQIHQVSFEVLSRFPFGIKVTTLLSHTTEKLSLRSFRTQEFPISTLIFSPLLPVPQYRNSTKSAFFILCLHCTPGLRILSSFSCGIRHIVHLSKKYVKSKSNWCMVHNYRKRNSKLPKSLGIT